MNKKLLMFGIMGVFALALVSAIAYYAIFSSTITVLSSVTIDGETTQDLGEVYNGEEIVGEPITISNNAPSERVISITEDSDENVTVSYIGMLKLTQKEVDFNKDVWDAIGEEITVYYIVVGDEFRAIVNESDQDSEYVLIYYKDNSDRFNSPAQAILIEDVEGNLPYEDDKNADEYDYCETGEYDTCHGAKIWYVPSSAILDGNELDWSRASEFYYETELIQYNSDGLITLYSGTSLTIIPLYEVNQYANGTFTITTTVA